MTTYPTLFDYEDRLEPEPTSICCPNCRGTGRIPLEEVTSRATDPSTARRAGEKHRDSARFGVDSVQARVLRAIGARPATAQEAATWVHGPGARISAVEGTRRRVSSLSRLGLIRLNGEERINPGSSTPSAVYEITDAGRRTLDRLLETGWSV